MSLNNNYAVTNISWLDIEKNKTNERFENRHDLANFLTTLQIVIESGKLEPEQKVSKSKKDKGVDAEEVVNTDKVRLSFGALESLPQCKEKLNELYSKKSAANINDLLNVYSFVWTENKMYRFANIENEIESILGITDLDKNRFLTLNGLYQNLISNNIKRNKPIL
jgi:hypothetical protein